MTKILFGSMFNPEKTYRRHAEGKLINPECDIENLHVHHGEQKYQFGKIGTESSISTDEQKCQFGTIGTESSISINELLGRSQVKSPIRPQPRKLELSNEDEKFLSSLTSNIYGFAGFDDSFWVHTRKPGGALSSMGDGAHKGISRHEFVNKLVNNKAQAFQIAGTDKHDVRKLITVVKNSETNTTTMYTCDFEECYPMVIDGDVDLGKLATAITDDLAVIVGTTVWKE